MNFGFFFFSCIVTVLRMYNKTELKVGKIKVLINCLRKQKKVLEKKVD